MGQGHRATGAAEGGENGEGGELGKVAKKIGEGGRDSLQEVSSQKR